MLGPDGKPFVAPTPEAPSQTRIPGAFDVLMARVERDPERPDIEFYRRRDEVDVLLPVA